ncbi:sulfatase, partial [Pseudomonas jessenii]
MDSLKTAPMRFLLLVTGTWLAIFFLTRTVLLLTHLDEAGSGFLSVFGIGLLYDLGFIAYAALPMGLYLLLCPPALWRTRGHRWFLQGLLTVSLFAMLFTSVAEWLFWDEFGVRFNFIAVDYLVYSDEVLNNLLESYPIGTLLSILAVLAVVLSFALREPFKAALDAPLPPLRGRLLNALGLLIVAGLSLQLL